MTNLSSKSLLVEKNVCNIWGMLKEIEVFHKPKLVYIAHKMGDDVEGNSKAVLEICKKVLFIGATI